MKSPYTDDELKLDAKSFTTRAGWRASGEAERIDGLSSHYGSALKRGRAFMKVCCAHMVHGQAGNNYNQRYTNEVLMVSAKNYQHRRQWKVACPGHYNAAWRRGLLDECCAHMLPAANPYAGDYVVYAYEFIDRHVYVGLTFRPQQRNLVHHVRGPVHEHAKITPAHSYKIVEAAIPTPQAAAIAEQRWTAKYVKDGWVLLNSHKPGGTGSVVKTQWTREAVIAEAQKYQSKQAWIDGSQFTYRLAKREGWFAEASAHMPARVLGVGLGVKRSAETRAKLKDVAERRSSDPKWRKAHSAALKGRKHTEAHKLAISRGMASPN